MKVKITLIDDDGKILEGETTLQLSGKQKAVGKPIKVDVKAKKREKEPLGDRISHLIDESFFEEPKKATEVQDELGIRGFHYNIRTIMVELLHMIRKGQLRRIKEKEGKKEIYKYVNP